MTDNLKLKRKEACQTRQKDAIDHQRRSDGDNRGHVACELRSGGCFLDTCIAKAGNETRLHLTATEMK